MAPATVAAQDAEEAQASDIDEEEVTEEEAADRIHREERAKLLARDRRGENASEGSGDDGAGETVQGDDTDESPPASAVNPPERRCTSQAGARESSNRAPTSSRAMSMPCCWKWPK